MSCSSRGYTEEVAGVRKFCKSCGAVVVAGVLFFACSVDAAIPVSFNFLDSPGEGFFDTTPLSDPDVPSASTIGEARRIVLQAAGDHLGSFFDPSFAGETWIVEATFDPLAGGIASAGPTSGDDGATFSGGTAGIWYPASLANHLAQTEEFTGAVVVADFDVNTDWDYDMLNPPSGIKESLFSTSVHEILHGLGFLSDILQDGTYFDGIPSIFDTFLERGTTPVTSLNNSGRSAALVSDNLFFTGAGAVAANPLGAGPVQIHAPAVYEEGSTGSHLDRDAFEFVGDLMLPEASSSVPEQIFMSDLDVAMMADLGYTLAPANFAAADFNEDGFVDGADLAIWETNYGTFSATKAIGDADNNMVVDGFDFLTWQTQFGTTPSALSSVPEPASVLFALTASISGLVFRQRRVFA